MSYAVRAEMTHALMARLRTLALGALLCIASVAQAATAERVSFESLDIEPETGVPVTITALYFRPATNTSGKTPAVVARHGCGGIHGTAPAWRDRLTPRHQPMADLLVAEGYAVLFPDSFNARGRREICSLKAGCQGIIQDRRRLDVLAALSFLRTRAEVDGKRVALLGWSHGGSATLASINRLHPVVAQFVSVQAPADRFYRTAVALYPGCIESIRAPFSYAPATEVSIFIGESDDRTSSRPCVALGERMAAVKQQASSPTYRDTDHGFDTPNMVRPLHLDVPTASIRGRA